MRPLAACMTPTLLCLAGLAVGCGDDDASSDAGVVGDAGTCAFRAPVPILELSSNANDFGPWLTPDGLEIYFHSDRSGGAGAEDLYRASRASTGTAFSTPVGLATLNTASNDSVPALSGDGRSLYFVSNRPGGLGGDDIWVATRPATSDSFGAAVNIAVVNSPDHEIGPTPSPDGLTLYFATNRPPAVALYYDIWAARRTSTTASFGAPLRVAELSSDGAEFGFALSADQLTVLMPWTADYLNFEILTASRASVLERFGVLERVPELESPGADSRPRWLSPDGLSLYMSSSRELTPSSTDFNLWLATRPCR